MLTLSSRRSTLSNARGVLVDLTVLHDHDETISIEQDRRIGERIAVDEHQSARKPSLISPSLSTLPPSVISKAAIASGATQRFCRRVAVVLDEEADVA